MQKVVMNIAHAFIQLSKNWLNHWSRIRVLYTHAHAKAKSPRNGLVYLCWGWKTLENHYFLFVFMYMKCMTKRNRLVRKRNTSWNIWFPQSFRFAQYYFIYDTLYLLAYDCHTLSKKWFHDVKYETRKSPFHVSSQCSFSSFL